MFIVVKSRVLPLLVVASGVVSCVWCCRLPANAGRQAFAQDESPSTEQALDLSGTSVTDAELEQQLAKLPGLKELDLSACEVITDGDARETRAALASLDADEGEVGRPTADVHDEREPRAAEGRLEILAVRVEPVVERGLRLLDEA